MSQREWKTIKEYQDILFEFYNGIAKITINRPRYRNAFTPTTTTEISDALYYCRECQEQMGKLPPSYIEVILSCWKVFSQTAQSVYWPKLCRILSAGLTMTIPLTIISFVLAMLIATVVALVQYARVPVLRQIARFYIWVIRGTPLLVQLFIIFYGLPSIGILLDAFPAAVIAFAINEGAYCAETMRAALESVPQGQLEAGYCVGMSWWQIDAVASCCPKRCAQLYPRSPIP